MTIKKDKTQTALEALKEGNAQLDQLLDALKREFRVTAGTSKSGNRYARVSLKDVAYRTKSGYEYEKRSVSFDPDLISSLLRIGVAYHDFDAPKKIPATESAEII